jgi:hypothetical protein
MDFRRDLKLVMIIYEYGSVFPWRNMLQLLSYDFQDHGSNDLITLV